MIIIIFIAARLQNTIGLSQLRTINWYHSNHNKEKGKRLKWLGAPQGGIYYHCLCGQLSTTCSNATEAKVYETLVLKLSNCQSYWTVFLRVKSWRE